MASRLIAAAAAAALPSSSPLSRLISRRCLADPSDRYWPARVNIWEDPMSPMRWKASHFVVASVTVWAGLVYGGLKLFGGEEKHNTEVPSARENAK